MKFLAVILILVISAVIDYPLIMKASKFEEESQDPTDLRKVLLYAAAGFVVPSMVTVAVFKLLMN